MALKKKRGAVSHLRGRKISATIGNSSASLIAIREGPWVKRFGKKRRLESSLSLVERGQDRTFWERGKERKGKRSGRRGGEYTYEAHTYSCEDIDGQFILNGRKGGTNWKSDLRRSLDESVILSLIQEAGLPFTINSEEEGAGWAGGKDCPLSLERGVSCEHLAISASGKKFRRGLKRRS